jgi:hypothetical protein
MRRLLASAAIATVALLALSPLAEAATTKPMPIGHTTSIHKAQASTTSPVKKKKVSHKKKAKKAPVATN